MQNSRGNAVFLIDTSTATDRWLDDPSQTKMTDLQSNLCQTELPHGVHHLLHCAHSRHLRSTRLTPLDAVKSLDQRMFARTNSPGHPSRNEQAMASTGLPWTVLALIQAVGGSDEHT
ncbi:unnamed protein product [Symbiodinium sp. CCMP2592]|nr:unnamed protein product [Symbiodinium sp. CCMP2592]